MFDRVVWSYNRSGGIEIKERPMRRQKRPWTLILVIFLIGILIGVLIGYFYGLVVSQVGGESIRLEMVYGSEKRGWVEEIAPLFEEWWEDEFPEVEIDVFFRPLGSRESMISVITGGIKPTIWSPSCYRMGDFHLFSNNNWHMGKLCETRHNRIPKPSRLSFTSG